MKKGIFAALILIFSLFSLFGQQTISDIVASPSKDSSKTEKESFFSSIDKSLFFTLGPRLLVNTDSSTGSAPSPICYSFGLGGDFLFQNGFLLEGQASFFTNYYLWDGEKARPAEVENRTATALSSMIDLCCGYSWVKGQNQSHYISLMGGTGIFLRYGLLSSGVSGDDPNRNGQSTASQDLSDINSSFYSKANFLYQQIAFSYSYKMSDFWKIGGEFRFYIPVGSIISGDGMDGAMFSLSLKLNYR